MHETQPLRLLIIDDQADDRDQMMRSLRKAFPGSVLHEITNQQEFDTALGQSPFEVVVAEYRLKGL